MNWASFDDFLDKTRAHFFILERPDLEAPAVYGGKSVGVIGGDFPWARSVLDDCADIQLDATFRPVRHSILYAPLAIVADGSLPLAFEMGPSESSDPSTTFARFIDLLGIPNYTTNPILRDEGSALQACRWAFSL
jgi:hypothetical protein